MRDVRTTRKRAKRAKKTKRSTRRLKANPSVEETPLAAGLIVESFRHVRQLIYARFREGAEGAEEGES